MSSQNTVEKKANRNSIDMLHGPLVGKLFLFAIPLAFSSIFQQLFNSTDAIVARTPPRLHRARRNRRRRSAHCTVHQLFRRSLDRHERDDRPYASDKATARRFAPPCTPPR